MILDVRTVAAALGGEVAGRDRVLAPGPGHSPADRSLSVLLSPTAPGGLLVTSHAGDDWRDCRDHVRRRLGIRPQVAPVAAMPSRPVDDADRTARALALWSEAFDPRGTPVAAYLRRRGLALPAEACTTALRWHPSCPFGDRKRSGAMLALVRDVLTDEPRAIHRTALAPDGTKRDDLGTGGRKALGPIAGGAVKLTPDADVTTVLGIGEGIESVLSLRAVPEFGDGPVWSLLAANQVARLPVLAGVEALWIAVDHDPTGIEAAATVAARWAEREVFRITPRRERADLNDLIGKVA